MSIHQIFRKGVVDCKSWLSPRKRVCPSGTGEGAMEADLAAGDYMEGVPGSNTRMNDGKTKPCSIRDRRKKEKAMSRKLFFGKASFIAVVIVA